MDPTRKVRYTCTTSVAKKVKADDDITDVNVTVDHDVTNQDEASTILKEVKMFRLFQNFFKDQAQNSKLIFFVCF